MRVAKAQWELSFLSILITPRHLISLDVRLRCLAPVRAGTRKKENSRGWHSRKILKRLQDPEKEGDEGKRR
jgi:hypothetical protein